MIRQAINGLAVGVVYAAAGLVLVALWALPYAIFAGIILLLVKWVLL